MPGVELLDWTRLKPYGSSKAKSFEELCYQVAKTLYGHEGRFTSVDDSGGGDGVEFYLERPDGTVWGWQAKFYFPEPRWDDSRKASIKGSLKKALEVHPTLTHWYLCTPSSMTPGEAAWFTGNRSGTRLTTSLPDAIPPARAVQLHHWSDSDLGTWLSEPRFSGKRSFFFGELELDLEWFRGQLDKRRPQAEREFTSDLHVSTEVDGKVQAYLGGGRTLERLSEHQVSVNAKFVVYQSALDTVLAELTRQKDAVQYARYSEVGKQFAEVFLSAWRETGEALNLARAGRFVDLILPPQPWEAVQQSLNNAEATLAPEGQRERFYYGPGPDEPPEDDELKRVRELGSQFFQAMDSVLDEGWGIHNWLGWMTQPAVHLHGEAGQGKTHTVFNLCHDRLGQGLPALYLSGRSFESGRTLEEQLRALLDIPPSYSWQDFLAALSTAAAAYRTRIPLVLDGLNEAGPLQARQNLWSQHLEGVIAELRRHPEILLITTCRSSYLEAVWPDWSDKKPHPLIQVRGFEGSPREAVQLYFEHYRIQAHIHLTTFRQFTHPIYLRMFCEVYSPEHPKNEMFYASEVSLYDVFERYLQQANRKVVGQLDLHSTAQPLRGPLEQLALCLWNSGKRNLPLNDFRHLVGETPQDRWLDSRAQMILAEGLVAERNTYRDSGEQVGFTYDLMAGYLIAHELLRTRDSDFAVFLGEDTTQAALLGRGSKARHPLAEDIGRCLAVLCRQNTGRHLHDLAGDPAYLEYVRPILFELPTAQIGQPELALLREWWAEPRAPAQVLDAARATLFVPDHPLNASFWSAHLATLSVVERDLSWTEWVRSNALLARGWVKLLESNSSSSPSDEEESRLFLYAEMGVWFLTSTNRTLRDLATRALVCYACRQPLKFTVLLERFVSVNDPYVLERVLAVACGTMLAKRYEPSDGPFLTRDLPNWGRFLYAQMFAPRAPRRTTHVLARDYARRIVGEAALHGGFTPREIKAASAPFPNGGGLRWGRSKERDKGKYRDGDRPLGMDFENYTLARLTPKRRNYDYDDTNFQTVRDHIHWRIYNLGYSLSTFSGIDQEIADRNYTGRGEDGTKLERYGKKYAWIAYYELAGHYMDQGLYTKDVHNFADIDPSFPWEPRHLEQVRDSWLGNEQDDTLKWVQTGEVPRIEPLLMTHSLPESDATWVLLDGYVNQEDDALGRHRFTFIRSFLVAEDQHDAFLERFRLQDLGGRWLPDVPDFHERYAADLPPDEVYDHDHEMKFSHPTSSGPVKFSTPQPVIEAQWPGYKSAANPEWSVTVPAHDLVQRLQLRQTHGTFAYVDLQGRPVFEYGVHTNHRNRQHFAYLERTALDSYLHDTHQRLVWAVWGERTLSTSALEQWKEQGQGNLPDAALWYQVFQQVLSYPDLD